MLRFIISTDDIFIGDEKKRLQDYQIPLLLPWLLLTQGLSQPPTLPPFFIANQK